MGSDPFAFGPMASASSDMDRCALYTTQPDTGIAFARSDKSRLSIGILSRLLNFWSICVYNPKVFTRSEANTQEASLRALVSEGKPDVFFQIKLL